MLDLIQSDRDVVGLLRVSNDSCEFLKNSNAKRTTQKHHLKQSQSTDTTRFMTHQHQSLESTLSAAFSNPALQAVLAEHRSASDRLLEKTGSVVGAKGTTSSSANPSTEGKASNLPVSNCGGSFYVTNIKIGGQSLPVVIDSGSSDLWVESSLCDETCTASSSRRYDASQSSTFRPVEVDRSDFYIEYLDETIIEGTHGYETVTLGGIQIPNQVFAQASSTINTTNVCDEVGLLGLGFSDISSQSFPALLSNLKEQDITMFSLYLTDHNDYQVVMNQTTHFEDPIAQTPPTSTASELTLGGVNPERYRGCLGWHELGQFRNRGQAFKGYWDFALDGVKVGSTEVPSSSLAMVDSGTTITLGSQETIGRIAKMLGMDCFVRTDSLERYEAVQCDDPFGYDIAAAYCDEISSVEPLTFLADGKSYALTSTELLRRINLDDSEHCFLRLEGVPGFSGWLLGMNFLRKYYTVFDFAQKRLGFAEARAKSSTRCQADSSYFVGDIPDGAKPIAYSTPWSTSPSQRPSYHSPTPHYSPPPSNDASVVLTGFLIFIILVIVFFFIGVVIGACCQALTHVLRRVQVRCMRVRTNYPDEAVGNTRDLELSTFT